MENCIFCKIVRGEIPSAKVLENEKVLAFLDINPVSKGHTLVIPKTHYASYPEMPADVLTALGEVLQKIGTAVKSQLDFAGFNVLLNNDRAAGQLIDHSHFHLIPRNVGDGVMDWPPVRPYAEGEMEAIRAVLASAVS
ncbi:MAG: HIT family protein [Deltaproteobacteria bacterium]|nr:MAG: HIT family protein [Deltaproteobacteria bacterium]